MPRIMVRLVWVVVVLAVAFAAGIMWLHSPLPPPREIGQNQITNDALTKTNLHAAGPNLYFTEISPGRFSISKVATGGGEISTVPTPFPSAELLDVSHDYSSLMVVPNLVGAVSEYPFWLLPAAGGSPRHFGSVTGHESTWSPDGQQVLFVSGSALFVASADGAQVRELAHVPGTPFFPRYSPDGKRIRFSIGDLNQNISSLWEIRSDGTGLHQLLPGWRSSTAQCCGSWTADGHYYVFQVAESDATSTKNLWTLAEPAGCFHRKASTAPVQLTSGTISFGNPIPSPDSKRIWALGMQLRGILVKYDAESKQFVPFLSGISASDLAFSRDGQWVAYVTVPDGTLWRSRIDGSDKLQLTQLPVHAALPSWSPDGKQIAYVAYEPGKPWKIILVPAEGGTSRPMLAEDRTQIDINWSADGKKIVFGRVSTYANEGLTIQTYDLQSGELSKIPGSDGLFSPRVSPDGRYIVAFSPFRTGPRTLSSKIMLFDSRTQKWSDWVSEPEGDVDYPVWSADSKYIYFDNIAGGEAFYSRAKVGEAHFERLFSLKGVERYLGPFGLWSGRAPDGSTLALKDASAQEIYSIDVNLP